MSPLEHTLIATCLLYLFFKIGHSVGIQKGIRATLDFLEEEGSILLDKE